MLKQRFVSLFLLGCAGMAAQAADYPIKQIRLVVPVADLDLGGHFGSGRHFV